MTDYSEGMLENAQKTVQEIQETFPEKRLDLYPVIQKLLKKDGIFSCSLIGKKHNRELHQLVRRFYPEIKIPSESFDINLEMAEEELQQFFSGIEWWEQKNDLLVPDARLVYDYVASYSKEAAEILQKDRTNFLKQVESEKNPDGLFYIHKSTGVVVCRQSVF